MCAISNPDRSDSFSEESGEIGNIETAFTIKQFYKDLIQKADSVPLTTVLSHYGIKIDVYTKKVTCPFKKHSNGRERTPSFQYYPDTNTFYCHGCKSSRSSTDFVAIMDNTSNAKAAYKILELYGSEVTSDGSENDQIVDYSERLEIMMDFSNFVREFMRKNYNNKLLLVLINLTTEAFDKMNDRHELDNVSLKDLVEKLKSKVERYSLCRL
ncbi:MAG TPA: CHC2 zinc finger domain-containing protein [Cytophagaceae bacterium]|jgi:DNA primase|nr:CHC2 zinc finger domain-containing protein [Cytophagaceae bacterium]